MNVILIINSGIYEYLYWYFNIWVHIIQKLQQSYHKWIFSYITRVSVDTDHLEQEVIQNVLMLGFKLHDMNVCLLNY